MAKSRILVKIRKAIKMTVNVTAATSMIVILNDVALKKTITVTNSKRRNVTESMWTMIRLVGKMGARPRHGGPRGRETRDKVRGRGSVHHPQATKALVMTATLEREGRNIDVALVKAGITARTGIYTGSCSHT